MTAAIDDQLAELATDPAVDELLVDPDYSPPIGAAGGVDLDVSRETSTDEPPAPTRRRPGPPPNPNSKRQQRKRATAAKAAAPRKRTSPNTSSTGTAAAAAEPDNIHERGAIAVLGWIARPLALAGMGLTLRAAVMPGGPNGEMTAKARRIGLHGQALSLDSATLIVHGPELAKGITPLAESLPWMAAVFEKAAQVSPVAAAVEAGAGILMQVLCNHGLVPVSPMLGTLAPHELLAAAGLDVAGLDGV